MADKEITKFVSINNIEIKLTEDRLLHALEGHPEVTIDQIKRAIEAPDEIRKSNSNNSFFLMYKIDGEIFGKDKYFCVVVKNSQAEYKVWTAYETTKIKNGELLYKKG
jgi:hypothetical protein